MYIYYLFISWIFELWKKRRRQSGYSATDVLQYFVTQVILYSRSGYFFWRGKQHFSPWQHSFRMEKENAAKRGDWMHSMHCKDKIPKFRNKYIQKRNIGVSVPIFTFLRLWANCIFPWSVCLFCWRKYVDRSWDYINRSQTHECWNWGWGRAIPRKGIHKWDFPCSVTNSFQNMWYICKPVYSCT